MKYEVIIRDKRGIVKHWLPVELDIESAMVNFTLPEDIEDGDTYQIVIEDGTPVGDVKTYRITPPTESKP